MARRLIPLLVVFCLGAAGLWLMHRGIQARVNVLPAAGVSVNLAQGQPINQLAGSGSAVVDWRTLQADRELSPGLARVGETSFHAGLGFAAGAWSLALLWLLGVSRALRTSRVLSALWLVPAGWSLLSMALQSGPWAPSAAMAMESFRVHAPVFGLFLCLGVSFRSGSGRD